MPYYISCTLGVRAKTKLRTGRIFIQVSCEVNDGVVVRDLFNVFAQNVVAGTAGKIVSGKKPADMRAQITTATGNKNSHLNKSGAWSLESKN